MTMDNIGDGTSQKFNQAMRSKTGIVADLASNKKPPSSSSSSVANKHGYKFKDFADLFDNLTE